MSITIITDEKYYRTAGEFYGYPKCCIDEFVTHAILRKGPDQLRASAADCGFVPCTKHAKAILAGEITLSSLIKDRQCSVSFDEYVVANDIFGREAEEFDNFIASIT